MAWGLDICRKCTHAFTLLLWEILLVREGGEEGERRERERETDREGEEEEIEGAGEGRKRKARKRKPVGAGTYIRLFFVT